MIRKQSTYKVGKIFARHFTKEDTHMANKNMERCPPSLVTIQVQIKTTLRSHYITISGAKNKLSNMNLWQYQVLISMLSNWNSPALLVGVGMVRSLWKTARHLLIKLNIYLTYNPAIPFLGIYTPPKKIVKHVYTKICTHIFIAKV